MLKLYRKEKVELQKKITSQVSVGLQSHSEQSLGVSRATTSASLRSKSCAFPCLRVEPDKMETSPSASPPTSQNGANKFFPAPSILRDGSG